MNIITFKYFMINLYPIVHKVACASCGGLTTLPIDILQTKVLTNQKVNINPDELQYMFISCDCIHDLLNISLFTIARC